MLNRSRALIIGLMLILAGCAQPAAVAPIAGAPEAAGLDAQAERAATGYGVQQSYRFTRWYRDFLARRRISMAVEEAIFTMVNTERAKAGLPALTHATNLRNVARSHSIDMNAKSYFAHNSPDGKTPADRLTAAGIGFSSWAENIRWVSAPRTDVANDIMYETTTGWMNSPGHRANILNGNLTQIGVGVYLNPARDRYYATQVFIKP